MRSWPSSWLTTSPSSKSSPIHSILIGEFGGTEGIRDLDAHESAVFRPRTGYYDDPTAEAGALLESLIHFSTATSGRRPRLTFSSG